MLGARLSTPSFSNAPIVIIFNQKTIQNYQPVSKFYPMQAYADVQPYKPRGLELAIADQRTWDWKSFVVNSPIEADNGDSILYNTTYYKIMNILPFQDRAGFNNYICIKDFQNTPNFQGQTINAPNGLAICNIIENCFANSKETNPLFDGQIFLYNSNYTLPSITTFFVIVRLKQARSIGSQTTYNLNQTTGETEETISTALQEVYEINIVSADGSSADIPLNVVKNALNSSYSKKKQTEDGFTLGTVNDELDESGTIGGTTATRKVITINCQSAITNTFTNLDNFTSFPFECLFEQAPQ